MLHPGEISIHEAMGFEASHRRHSVLPGSAALCWGCFCISAVSTVNVLEPDDIVFIEITSRLDLDQEGRDPCRDWR
jgi:hypothetical protein